MSYFIQRNRISLINNSSAWVPILALAQVFVIALAIYTPFTITVLHSKSPQILKLDKLISHKLLPYRLVSDKLLSRCVLLRDAILKSLKPSSHKPLKKKLILIWTTALRTGESNPAMVGIVTTLGVIWMSRAVFLLWESTINRHERNYRQEGASEAHNFSGRLDVSSEDLSSENLSDENVSDQGSLDTNVSSDEGSLLDRHTPPAPPSSPIETMFSHEPEQNISTEAVPSSNAEPKCEQPLEQLNLEYLNLEDPALETSLGSSSSSSIAAISEPVPVRNRSSLPPTGRKKPLPRTRQMVSRPPTRGLIPPSFGAELRSKKNDN